MKVFLLTIICFMTNQIYCFSQTKNSSLDEKQLELACKKKDGKACFTLSIKAEKKNNTILRNLLRYKACSYGHKEACNNFHKSIKSCETGNAKACHKTAGFYIREKNYKDAKVYFKKACDLQHGLACFLLGRLFSKELDIPKASEYTRKALLLGNNNACKLLTKKKCNLEAIKKFNESKEKNICILIYSDTALSYHYMNKHGICMWKCNSGTKPNHKTGKCDCINASHRYIIDSTGRRKCYEGKNGNQETIKKHKKLYKEKNICKKLYPESALPYHRNIRNERCTWSCAAGTKPNPKNGECICQDGKKQFSVDKLGRRVCK